MYLPTYLERERYIHVCIYICVCVCVRVCVCLCMYVYTYIYTHTYTYIYNIIGDMFIVGDYIESKNRLLSFEDCFKKFIILGLAHSKLRNNSQKMITKLKMFRGQTVSAKWEKTIFNTFYHIKIMKTLIIYVQSNMYCHGM